MNIQDIMKELTLEGVSTSIQYNLHKNQYYIDLQTEAKSELHLYEDGILRGRYNYESTIDLAQDAKEIILDLCHEFNYALHGREYCQKAWYDLCQKNDISLKIYE